MDGRVLQKAFIIGDMSIVAIPGGFHPVVASPVSELLYIWGLAGTGGELMMRNIDKFAYIESFESIITKLEEDQIKKIISKNQLKNLCEPFKFTLDQEILLESMLKEKGIDIE